MNDIKKQQHKRFPPNVASRVEQLGGATPGEEARTPQTEPIDFTAALHTYVEVADASMPEVFVRGLSGKTYLDKAGFYPIPQLSTFCFLYPLSTRPTMRDERKPPLSPSLVVVVCFKTEPLTDRCPTEQRLRL